MNSGRALLAAALVLLSSGCHPRAPKPDALALEPARFAELDGWPKDDFAGVVEAFRRSCEAILKRPDDEAQGLELTAADWKAPCAEAARLPAGDGAAARRFLEADFAPYRASNAGRTEGLFTGYYEAEIHGARQQSVRYPVPIYRRPSDLVTVDLGSFRQALKGERIAGRVEGGRLVPYATRSEIERDALAGKGLELLWADNPVDVFFLEIQGSGRAVLDDGTVMRLGYDGDNGRPYVSIGKVLVGRGVPAQQITAPFLRDWISAHGPEGLALMNENPSFVFFRPALGEGPIGSEGVVLTAGRSAAIDHRFLPFGLPAWVDAEDPVSTGGRLQRLVVLQDTGGAIRGPVRADIFFGYGAEATTHAGVLKGKGRLWVLIPKAAAGRATSRPAA